MHQCRNRGCAILSLDLIGDFMSGSKAVWVDGFHLELYGVRVPGWYAFDENHKAVMGPFSSREECEHEIAESERGAF
jgi:hypothetical protein